MTNESDTPDGLAPEPAAEAPAPTPEPDLLATMTADRDRLKESLLRSLADADNYRKRSRRDLEESVRKAKEDTFRELLPVFDNLERALQYAGTSSDVKAISKGIEMVLKLFEDTLGRLGGKRLRTIGQPFDPAQHEALQQMESEHPAGTVAREELPGYMLGERLIRPAMVVVSKGNVAAPSSVETSATDPGPPPGDASGRSDE